MQFQASFHSMDRELQDGLLKRQQQSLYRHRKILDGQQQTHVEISGKPFLSFCSNDYLGLANHPDLIKRLHAGLDRYGVGAGAAHLISGHTHAHHALEEELAAFTGRERAVLFSTGYMANIGIVSALLSRHDAVFQDKLNHASLIDAAQQSRALLKRYPHNDIHSLNTLLSQSRANRKLVMSDAVFSMDGDQAPVLELATTCQQQNAWLMLDDAHGFGVLGEQGAGITQLYGLTQQQVPIYMATLGKAMGVFGAFVAGSEALIETLIQQARPYIYTTAMPAALAEALRESLRIVQQENWRRDKLKALIQRFRAGATELGLRLMESTTPIQPLLVGESSKAQEISEALYNKGILISAIRPPTVAAGTARLRITFSATHKLSEVDLLLAALEDVGL